MIQKLICRILRHDHSVVRIFCTPVDGGKPLISQKMDRWSAEYILANHVAPSATFAGREVASCRIIVGGN